MRNILVSRLYCPSMVRVVILNCRPGNNPVLVDENLEQDDSVLTVSLPNKMSTYGMASIIGFLKNWHKNGADRFIMKSYK